MKRTIAIKLNANEEQDQALFALEELFNLACNYVAEIAIEKGETNRIRLHHLSYYLLRKELPTLGAQICCNAIAKGS